LTTGEQAHPRFTAEDHLPPIDRIGQCPAPQAETDEQHQLGSAEQPDREVGAGEFLHLERNRYEGDEAAEHRHRATADEKAEVSARAKGTDIDGDMARKRGEPAP
jgi:hypothetical protein